MERELRELIVGYVERVGENAAIKNASVAIDSLVEILDEEGINKSEVLSTIAFKMALIEYFYFDDDVQQKALKLTKTLQQ